MMVREGGKGGGGNGDWLDDVVEGDTGDDMGGVGVEGVGDVCVEEEGRGELMVGKG